MFRRAAVGPGRTPIREAPTVLRARVTPRGLLAEAAVLLGAAVVLALTGPFGTFHLGPWPERLAYWLRTAAAGYLLLRPLLWLGARAAVRLRFAEAWGWVAAAVVSGAPTALWLWWFGPRPDPSRPAPGFADLLETAGQVLVLSGLFLAGLWAARAPPRVVLVPAPDTDAAPPTEPEPSPEPSPGPRLAERLPQHLGGEVVALRMEDHYVRVFTRRGEALVLMRMSDAVAELAAVDGAQVHRSWWVARAAVTSTRRRGRAVELVLDTGLAAPVARSRLPELRAAGWPL